MASNVSAGSVSLSMRLDDKEFLKQMSSISAQASKILSKSLAPSSNFDLSGIERSIKGLGAQMTKAIGETTKAVDILADTMNDQLSNALEGGVKTGAARATRAVNDFKMPKIKVELDQAQMERQLKIYSDRWKAIDDQRIQQSKIVEDIRNKQLNATPGSKQDMKLGMDLANASKRLQDLRLAANQADQQVVQLERNIRNIGVSTKPVENLKQEIKNIGTSGGDSAKRVRSAFKQTGSSAKLATSQINSGLKQTTQSADKAKSAVSGLGAGLSKAGRMGLALMGIRSILLGIRRIAQSVTESFRVMANSNSAFAGQLNGLTSAFDTLKGSFAAAIAPLVQALIPILQKVVEWATKAFNAIAIFFGALSGKKTVQIAVGSTKQFTENLVGVGGAGGGAAKGLGKATKAADKYKRSLAGFDEIEILDPTKGQADGGSGSGSGGGPGGGGGSTGGEPIFKEVSTGLGEIGTKLVDFFNKLKVAAEPTIDAMKRLWNNLKPLRDFVATALIDFYERFLKPVGLWVLGTGLPEFLDTIGELVQSIDWGRLNQSLKDLWDALAPFAIKIGEGLLNFFRSVLVPIGKWVMGEGIPRFVDAISNMLNKINWDKLNASLQNLWDRLAPFAVNVGQGLLWLWENVLTPLAGWVISDVIPLFLDALAAGLNVINEVVEALEPLWTWLWENLFVPIAEWTGGIVTDVLSAIVNALTSIGDWIVNNQEIVQNIAIVIGSFAAAWGLVNAALGIWNVLGPIGTGVTTALGAAFTFLTSPIGLVTIAIGAVIAIGVLLYKNWDQIKEWLIKTWNKIKEVAINVWNGIKDFFVNLWEGIKNTATSVWNGIKDFFVNIWESIKNTFSEAIDVVKGTFSGWWETIEDVWGNIKGIFNGIIDFVKNVFTGNWEGAWQAVVDIFRNIFDGIVNVVKAPINFIIDILNFFIRGLNKIRVPDWVPLIGGKGINIGEIPKLAQGGIIDQPTLAVVGEQGKEAVMPLENNTGWMDQMAEKLVSRMGSGQGGGDTSITLPVYLGTDTLIDVIEEAFDREGRRRNAPVL